MTRLAGTAATHMYIDFETVRTILRVANDPRTSTVRRAVFMNTLMSIWGLANGLNWLGERSDERNHADYRQTPLGKPVFIVAAPRSGTTFVHRLMSMDPQFTALKMYEQIFNTVSGRRVVEDIAASDGVGRKALDFVTRKIDERSFGGWEGMHDTGLNAHEEDEGLWALAAATPSMLLIMPEPEALKELRFIDRLPADRQAKLATHYREAIQRHLYLNPGKTLLGKNVFLPGRFKLVRKALPGSRFIHIVRHPYEALASMLSVFTLPWEYTAPDVRQDGAEAKSLADLMIDYIRYLHEEDVRSKADEQHNFITIRYRDLMSDPMRRIREAYDRLELEFTPQFDSILKAELQEQKDYRSAHAYSLEQFGLTKDYIYEALPEVFDYYDFER